MTARLSATDGSIASSGRQTALPNVHRTRVTPLGTIVTSQALPTCPVRRRGGPAESISLGVGEVDGRDEGGLAVPVRGHCDDRYLIAERRAPERQATAGRRGDDDKQPSGGLDGHQSGQDGDDPSLRVGEVQVRRQDIGRRLRAAQYSQPGDKRVGRGRRGGRSGDGVRP